MSESMQGDDTLRSSPSNGGTATNTSRSDSVTCPSCHVTVTMSRNLEGRRRLVCPYCRATYSHQESRVRAIPSNTDPLQHLRLPIVVRNFNRSKLELETFLL